MHVERPLPTEEARERLHLSPARRHGPEDDIIIRRMSPGGRVAV